MLICGKSHTVLRGTSPDYGSWSKWAYSSLGSRSLCLGHSVLPLPCENRRLSMGFCRDIFFLPVRAYRWSIWVSVQASILLVILQVGMTGNLYLLVVQSSACSPTKAPLRRSLQQNVQPSSTQQRRRPYWALTPSAAQVSTATVATPLITIDLQYMARHTWRSCNKFGVTDTFFFQAEDGIRDPLWSRGLGDVYKRQLQSSACSPTKAPIRSSLQQNAKTSFPQQRSRTY